MGCVATYGQVAQQLGVPRGARAVGWALRALPASREAQVPWHRVVGSGGRISLRPGPGAWLQRRLLQAEGVPFRAGRVDLDWPGPASQVRRGSRSRSRTRRAASRRTASSTAEVDDAARASERCSSRRHLSTSSTASPAEIQASTARSIRST